MVDPGKVLMGEDRRPPQGYRLVPDPTGCTDLIIMTQGGGLCPRANRNHHSYVEPAAPIVSLLHDPLYNQQFSGFKNLDPHSMGVTGAKVLVPN